MSTAREANRSTWSDPSSSGETAQSGPLESKRKTSPKSTNWRLSLSSYVDGIHFVVGLCEVLAIRLVGFGSLLYLLYKVLTHL
jgi:hypothetical protein